jgi:aminopeptidase N
MTQQPQAKYRHDYRAPDYLISDIDLTFDLDANKTVVTAVSQVTRQSVTAVPLRLDGEDLTLVSLHINDEAWTDYKEEGNQLVINNLPERFTLRIVNEISPAANTALEGLYQSGVALCTQCEAEGFRHITWYLDRPDVLARFTTKIIADKTLYPFLLSNGNRVGEGELENGRHWVQWQDPFPKPCYLFALVAGISTSCAIPLKPVLAAMWRWSCLLIAVILTARRGQ